MKKVILKGYIVVPEDELEIVKSELKVHINLTRKEGGCIDFQVEPDEKDKNRFNVYEKFLDQDSFQYHQERTKNSHWGKITKNVKRYYKIYGK